jgi:arsenical pump membrane protein
VLLGIAHSRAALEQAWPPFVLVIGLLVLGQLAGADGLFDAAATRLAGLGGSPLGTLLACLGLVALVTALLNLDTAVVFLTPVLIGVAGRGRLDPRPFLYGSVFMANASSLFLPGSNLTNLLVLSGHQGAGTSFFLEMLPAAAAATLVTATGIVLIHRRSLGAGASAAREPSDEAPVHPAPACLGAGLFGAVAAAALMVALANPALPVLGLALALLAWRVLRRRVELGPALAALGLPLLGGLFCLVVALGLGARSGFLPLGWLASAGPAATAGVAGLTSVAVNNLPAAVLLSATGHLQSQALLIGLNVGPNLAVTGSLAVLLWWRAARGAGGQPSVLAYSRQGLLLAPAAMVAAFLAGQL